MFLFQNFLKLTESWLETSSLFVKQQDDLLELDLNQTSLGHMGISKPWELKEVKLMNMILLKRCGDMFKRICTIKPK